MHGDVWQCLECDTWNARTAAYCEVCAYDWTDEMTDACDAVFDGTNGEGLVVSGCPGCVYILGAAAAVGLMGMAEAIRAEDARRKACSADECKAPSSDLTDHWCPYWEVRFPRF